MKHPPPSCFLASRASTALPGQTSGVDHATQASTEELRESAHTQTRAHLYSAE